MVEEERIGSCRRHAGANGEDRESPQEVGGHVGTARVTESGKSFREKPSALFGIISGTRVVVAEPGIPARKPSWSRTPVKFPAPSISRARSTKPAGGRRETVWRGGYPAPRLELREKRPRQEAGPVFHIFHNVRFIPWKKVDEGDI